MEFLVRISKSKKGIEIGTFTGYSSLCMASALPPDGMLTCLDISEEYTSVAKKYWKE
jgi:predicted O-methyltransferase YrrM